MWPDLEEWGATPQHATGDDVVSGDDDIRIVVVDDDFSDEPTRPDIDVGVSRRKTERTIVAVNWEDYK